MDFPSDDDASETSSEVLPRYTPEELAAIFLDFYQFLTTLHYKPEDLKVPPAEGWGDRIPSYGKSDFAVEVLRRLPYLNSDELAAIHYKSTLLDYTTLPHDFFTRGEKDTADEYYDFLREDYDVDPADVVFIATGYESGGRELLLDVLRGEIAEDIIRCDNISGVDVKEYFATLKEDYRSLRLIPCAGNVTIEAQDVPERDKEITEAEVRAQSKSWWTDLDAQYVRQAYRSHGWPDAFRREEAFKVVRELSETARHGWEAQDR